MARQRRESSQLLPPDALKGKSLGISVSGSPDLDRLGLVEDHFRLALGELGRSILVSGGHIFYGGNLDPAGYTTFLVDELQRWGRRDQPLKLCLAWTEHCTLSEAEVGQLQREFGLLAEIIRLDLDGNPIPTNSERVDKHLDLDSSTIARSLSGLRHFLAARTDARILLGGKRDGFQGDMPGIIEEALMSIEHGQPLFLAGGFGGATLDLIRTLRPEDARWFRYESVLPEYPERAGIGLQRVQEAAIRKHWDITSNRLSQ